MQEAYMSLICLDETKSRVHKPAQLIKGFIAVKKNPKLSLSQTFLEGDCKWCKVGDKKHAFTLGKNKAFLNSLHIHN